MSKREVVVDCMALVFRLAYWLALLVVIVLVIMRATDEIAGGFWFVTSPLWVTFLVNFAIGLPLIFFVGLIDTVKSRRKLDSLYKELRQEQGSK